MASVTPKNAKYEKINSVNPVYLMLNKMNGYFEGINENKYLTLAPTNGSKEKIKTYEELWIKIRNLTRSVTKRSDDYDEKDIKTKFYSDDEIPLNKTIEISVMIIVIRAIFMKIINIIHKFFWIMSV